MNIAAAYANLSAIQLKQMLGAAHADHRRQMAETQAKWVAEVASIREAVAKSVATWTADLRAMKNANTALQRELDAAYDELQRANSVIVEQERKLAAHAAVVELERKLNYARRLAS